MPGPRPNDLQYTNRGAAAWRRALLPAAAWLGSAAAVLAQDPAQPGGAGQTQIIRPGPSFFLEIVLVLFMCGVALFAVCRSSRRN
jgi:hypothetical protein